MIKSCFFTLNPPTSAISSILSDFFINISFFETLEQTELWGLRPLPHHLSPTSWALNERQGVVCEERNCKTTNSRKPRLPKNPKGTHNIAMPLKKQLRILQASGQFRFAWQLSHPYHPARRQRSIGGSGREDGG